jgi:hypothetical protein
MSEKLKAWRTVPVEPTEAMLDAAATQFLEGLGEYHDGASNKRPFARFYAAMLAASPVVPVGVSREEIARIIDPVAFLFGPGELEHKVYSSSRAHAFDRADAIIAALRPTDTGWRDITTAPKDGTMILVAYDDSAARTGRLEGPRERVYEAGWDEQQATFAARNGFLLHSAATHWMPLPPAPTDTGRE